MIVRFTTEAGPVLCHTRFSICAAYRGRTASHPTAYEDQYKEQVLKNLKRKAAKLGLKLAPVTA